MAEGNEEKQEENKEEGKKGKSNWAEPVLKILLQNTTAQNPTAGAVAVVILAIGAVPWALVHVVKKKMSNKDLKKQIQAKNNEISQRDEIIEEKNEELDATQKLLTADLTQTGFESMARTVSAIKNDGVGLTDGNLNPIGVSKLAENITKDIKDKYGKEVCDEMAKIFQKRLGKLEGGVDKFLSLSQEEKAVFAESVVGELSKSAAFKKQIKDSQTRSKQINGNEDLQKFKNQIEGRN